MSGITLLHADNGYSRHENFGAALVRSVVSIYLPDSTDVYDSRDLRGLGWGRGLRVVTSCS